MIPDFENKNECHEIGQLLLGFGSFKNKALIGFVWVKDKNSAKEKIEIFQKSKWKIKGANNFISKGKNTVFKYVYAYPESPYWSDDEKYEILYFEIQKGITSFEFVNEKLLEIGLFHYSYQHQGPKILTPLMEGSISGSLIEGVRHIKIRVAEFDYIGEVHVPKYMNKDIKQKHWD